jgi:putative endonuclease
MPHARTRLGDLGEQAAERLLLANGYELVARKWRCRAGEIDLIMRQGDELVFVEVRTRRAAGLAQESVGPRKQRRLVELAQHYVQTHQASCSWRIDVVAVHVTAQGRFTAEHICNAVEDAN